MKLYYILSSHLPTEKAYGVGVSKMCEALGKQAELVLVCPKNNKINQDFFDFFSVDKNFKIKYYKEFNFGWLGSHLNRLLNDAAMFIRCLFINAEKNDIFYIRDSINLLLKLKYKNICWEVHFPSGRDKLLMPLTRLAKKVIVVSNKLKQDLINRGVKSKNILIAHDAYDPKIFDIEMTKDEARKSLNLSVDKNIVCYTGRFTTKGMDKGIGDIIKALANLPNVIFVAVGGSDEDISRYKKEAKEVGVLKQTIWQGRVPQDELAIWQKASDVLLMPFPDRPHYRYYMSPLKMFEYMSSKRPMIVSDLPTIREVVSEREAMIVKPDNPRYLSRAIAELMSDHSKAERLAQSAYKKSKEFTWEKRVKKVLDFIK